MSCQFMLNDFRSSSERQRLYWEMARVWNGVDLECIASLQEVLELEEVVLTRPWECTKCH